MLYELKKVQNGTICVFVWMGGGDRRASPPHLTPIPAKTIHFTVARSLGFTLGNRGWIMPI